VRDGGINAGGMTPTRAATVSILLAGAALLGVVGGSKLSNDQPATVWFAAAGVTLVLALIANFWPASGRMPWWKRLRLYRERGRLRRSQQEGWEVGNRSGIKSTLLTLTGLRGRTAAGFYCEVHGPTGVFDAYTEAAQKAISEARGLIGVFAMPDPSSNAFVEFPDEFRAPNGDALTSVHDLPTGRYHQLWWAWERAADGMDVNIVFVALGWFDYYQAGGPNWRKSLAHYRAARRARRLQQDPGAGGKSG